MKTQILAAFSVAAILFSAASCEQHKWSSTKELFSHGDSHGEGHGHGDHKDEKGHGHAEGDHGHDHGEKKEEKH